MNTTDWYWARLAVVNAAASSVAVTVKLLAAPSDWTAAMPVPIDEWRKPAVLEKTRTLYGASAALAGAGLSEAAASRPAVAAANHLRAVRVGMTVPSRWA